ncbi:Aladin [Nymphon striatum]|nr:Aladin [Nymphon striatum]
MFICSNPPNEPYNKSILLCIKFQIFYLQISKCLVSNDFPEPQFGEITSCEYDGHLVTTEWSLTSLSFPSDLQKCPSLVVPVDLLKLCESKENCAKSAFLSGTETVWGKLITAWHEHGVMGVLEELNTLDESSARDYYVMKCARSLSAVIRWMYSLHGSLYPHLSLSNEDMVAEYSSTSQWKKSLIRCLAWHPFINKCAMALQDDSIFIETYGSAVKPVLKYRTQKNVADLAWRPFSSSQLAVASQSSILIWTIDPSSLITRTLWCVSSEEHVALRRMGGGGVSLVKWSPNGNNVFASTPAPLFRIWETELWTCERWSNLKGRCQAACWSPDGSDLLFTVTDQHSIFHVSLYGSKLALPIIDVGKVEYMHGDKLIKVGGRISQMIWDSTGERLAVSFRGDTKPCEAIALFRTRTKPSFEIFPCGYILGSSDSFPSYMAFKPNYDKGALLTVCWSSGDVSHIPLLFIPTSEAKNKSLSIKYDETRSFISPLRQRTTYSTIS